MLTPSLNTVMTRLLIVVAVLATLALVVPAVFAQEAVKGMMTVDYDENDTGAVITFTSTDPEGSGVDWDVTGLDADDFMIDERGVLTFKRSPNYESPTDRGREDDTTTTDVDEMATSSDNMYIITVRATEQRTEGADVRALSTETHVTVEVTDVPEPGMVTLTRLQPEVGTPIMAMVSDPDGTAGDPDGTPTDVTWQWYVSTVQNPVATANNHWIMATGDDASAGDGIYTPKGMRVTGGTVTLPDPNVAMDEGKYLRVVATYHDRNGATSTAMTVSMNAVRAEVSSDLDGAETPENGSPGFREGADYSRSVPENTAVGMPVGAPVVATDPNGDTLTYELDNDVELPPANPDGTVNTDDTAATGMDDVNYFSINKATGQIMVAMMLDFDMNGSPPDGKYMFYVRAIDPSGETAHVMVTVTATNANDAPMIMGSVASTGAPPEFVDRPGAPTELRVNEKAGDSYDGLPGMPERSVPGGMNVFTASDQDARGQIFWSIEGEDVDDFELTQSSPDPVIGIRGPDEPIALKFKMDPDYETPTDSNKDSVYKVTLVARDSVGDMDKRPLTIFVDNVPEDGMATLSEEQPLVGEQITAMVKDPDNGVAIVTWQWLKATSTADTFMVIPGATTGTYTPVKDDDGYYLEARATYTDITSETDDPDTVEIDERTQKASDTTNDVEEPEAKNPETEEDMLYRVTVRSENAVRVQPGAPTDVEAPEFSASSYDRMVAENSEVDTIVGDPVQAVPELDDKGNPETVFEYTLADTITGDDDFFTISPATGQIRVGEVDFPARLSAEVMDVPDGATDPDMIDPTLDYEGNNTFTLIVTAMDSDNNSRKAMTEVNITLKDLNEKPYFDKASREAVMATTTYSEHRTNAVVPMMAAVEPDGGDLRWEVTGDDADDFMIVDTEDIDDGKDRVQLVFKSQPDFENLKGSATSTLDEEGTAIDPLVPGDTYMVTVRATEMSAVGGGPALAAELDVAIRVTNHDEPGMVELNWLQPEVSTEIMATTTDPDGTGTDTVGYTWYRSRSSSLVSRSPSPDTGRLVSEWELIRDGGATTTGSTYTPVAADVGRYLLARASYSDGVGDDPDAAVGISANTVRADVPDNENNSPDFNSNVATRSVPEDTAVGMPVGAPVMVDTNEDGDVLTYEIVMSTTGEAATDLIVGTPGNSQVVAGDLPFFSIDKATGQLMVKKMLSAEETDGRRTYGADGATAGKYTIVVRATDPSGEPDDQNRDDIVVTITATDVDEAPGVKDGMAELSVCEVNDGAYVGLGYNTEDCALATTTENAMGMNNYNLYHRSEEDLLDRAEWPEPIAGPDGSLFEYSVPGNGIGRRLHFKSQPDYEHPMDANRDNVYEVTIRVVDSDDLVGNMGVRITVTNVDEMGTLTLSPEQPDDGMPVKAMITDPDSPEAYGGVVITNWEWAATTTSGVMDFPEGDMVDSSMYMHTGTVGQFLHARVSYRDGASVMDDPVTALDERNDYPGPGTPTDSSAQNFVENKKFMSGGADTLYYNSDEMATSSTANAVQPDPDPTTDPDAPATGVERFELMVYENVPSTGYVGDPLQDLMVKSGDRVLADRNMIGGPDGATFEFAEAHDSEDDDLTYYDGSDDTLTPADAMSLITATGGTDVDDKAGQLALAPAMHLDYEMKDTYVIEVTDPNAEIEISTYRVTIKVMDVNEAPTMPKELKGPAPVLNTAPMFYATSTDGMMMVATSTTRMVAENTAADMDIGDPVMATDADRGDTVTYTLGGADAASFAINSETGQLMTSAALDYETKMEYMVTVTATDSDGETAMIYVTVMVTNVGLDNMYDMNEDDTISRDEVIAAIRDYLFNDALDRDGVIEVIRLYLFP